MADHRPRHILIKRINFIWYPVALLPIAAILAAAAYGYIPYLFGLLAVFLVIFWFSSLGFALYARFAKKKDLRQ